MPVLVHCWPRGSEVGKTIYALKSRNITRAVHAVRTMHHQARAACRARARRAALCGYRVALLYHLKAEVEPPFELLKPRWFAVRARYVLLVSVTGRWRILGRPERGTAPHSLQRGSQEDFLAMR